MLYLYPKNDQENLTKPKTSLRYYGKLLRDGEMNKKMFNELLESVKEMDAIASDKKSHPGFLNIQILRFVQFARRLGFHKIGLLI